MRIGQQFTEGNAAFVVKGAHRNGAGRHKTGIYENGTFRILSQEEKTTILHQLDAFVIDIDKAMGLGW